MRQLLVVSERVAALLKQRKETVAVAESAAGGLITAALLAVPGASAYCLGGVVIYTRQAWEAVRDFDEGLLEGHRSATEQNALIRARIARDRLQGDLGHRRNRRRRPDRQPLRRPGRPCVGRRLRAQGAGSAGCHR